MKELVLVTNHKKDSLGTYFLSLELKDPICHSDVLFVISWIFILYGSCYDIFIIFNYIWFDCKDFL